MFPPGDLRDLDRRVRLRVFREYCASAYHGLQDLSGKTCAFKWCVFGKGANFVLIIYPGHVDIDKTQICWHSRFQAACFKAQQFGRTGGHGINQPHQRNLLIVIKPQVLPPAWFQARWHRQQLLQTDDAWYPHPAGSWEETMMSMVPSRKGRNHRLHGLPQDAEAATGGKMCGIGQYRFH